VPFSASFADGVLTLTLDTSGCAVNVFNRATAEGLLEQLGRLPADARAVVFRSAKPNSFINGVGLLLVQAARSAERVREAGSLFLRAYHAVRDCRLPTVAAIRGNCWGCGLEFVLNCKYRLVADTARTNFFMTEVVNYLLFPTFDGVHNLPRQLGLDRAVRLLLHGERWSGTRACREGLCNEVASHSRFEEATVAFTRRVLSGEVRSCVPATPRRSAADATTAAAAWAWIATLPPDHQPVYRNCLRHLERALEVDELNDSDRADVLACMADSILSAAGKSAHAYFYIQQIAEKRVLPLDPRAPATLTWTGDGADFTAFAESLAEQVVEGWQTYQNPGRLMLRPVEGTAAEETRVAVVLQPGPGVLPSGGLVAYSPTWRLTPWFVELISPRHADEAAQVVAAALVERGFRVIRSRPSTDPVSHRLLQGLLRPVVRYVSGGGNPVAVDDTLRSFGFVRPLPALVGAVGAGRLAELIAEDTAPPASAEAALLRLEAGAPGSGAEDRRLLDAIILWLLAAVRRALADGVVDHPSLIDVAARELLDFPLSRKSLCSLLTAERVGEALGRTSGQLVPPEVRAVGERFADERRGFYL
jgi:enoyl-CoA hydratase/carnithine racemase